MSILNLIILAKKVRVIEFLVTRLLREKTIVQTNLQRIKKESKLFERFLKTLKHSILEREVRIF